MKVVTMKTTPNNSDEIIEALLQTCRGSAMKISSILVQPDIVPLVEQYGETRVKSVIYSLATVGMLYMRGRTNSAYYQTTARGVYSLSERKFS